MEKWRNESQGCLTFRQTLFLDPFASFCIHLGYIVMGFFSGVSHRFSNGWATDAPFFSRKVTHGADPSEDFLVAELPQLSAHQVTMRSTAVHSAASCKSPGFFIPWNFIRSVFVDPWGEMDGQNGRPLRGPQMWMSSLGLTIQLLGYLIFTHTVPKLYLKFSHGLGEKTSSSRLLRS